MALLEIAGLYVVAAAAFYGYIVKTAGTEGAAPDVRRPLWHRPRVRYYGQVRRAH